MNKLWNLSDCQGLQSNSTLNIVMNRDFLNKEEKSLIQAYSQLPISVVEDMNAN